MAETKVTAGFLPPTLLRYNMSPFNKAWNFLKEEPSFREKYPKYILPNPNANPKRPPTEEGTYGDVPPDEHPLYGQEGFRGSEEESGSDDFDEEQNNTDIDEKKRAGVAEMPRLLSARPSHGLDLSTPKNPFRMKE